VRPNDKMLIDPGDGLPIVRAAFTTFTLADGPTYLGNFRRPRLKTMEPGSLKQAVFGGNWRYLWSMYLAY
jgi:hypothetical protein